MVTIHFEHAVFNGFDCIIVNLKIQRSSQVQLFGFFYMLVEKD